MEKGMDRREFLKATGLTGAVLLGGNFLQGTAMAQELVKIPESKINKKNQPAIHFNFSVNYWLVL